MSLGQQNSSYTKTLLFVVIALPLIVFAMTTIWHANALQVYMSGTDSVRFFWCAGSVLLTLVGAALSLKQFDEESHDLDTYVFGVFLASLAINLFEITSLVVKSHSGFNFHVVNLLNAFILVQILMIAIRSVRVAGNSGKAMALMCGGLLLALSLVRGAFGSLFSLVSVELTSGAILMGVQALLPLFIGALIVKNPRLRRDPDSLIASLQQTLLPQGIKSPQMLLFYGFSFCGLLSLVVYFTLVSPQDYKNLPLNSFALPWLPCLVYVFLNLRHESNLVRTHKALVTMTSRKAVRFFLRYKQKDKSQWAATVGLRTACFVIDHDPHNESTRRLTATLSHIRRDEISRFARRILSYKSLTIKAVSNQLLGSIDPEESSRPCVDVLTMFACVYLDVVPMVERRLKGLAALFPIIDPELAEMIKPFSIEESQAKMEWLYHLDFQWVDQQVVLSDTHSMYGVNIESINSIERNQVLLKLQEKNRTGNFIWIGEKAKGRISMEAPYLASIIEVWNVTTGDKNTNVYLIKFEELIPRLQKYYCLEETRSLLRDFEISADSKQVLNMLSMQFSRRLEYPVVVEIVNTIASYQWQGFKEKDAALGGIVKAYQCMRALKDRNDSSLPHDSEWTKLFLDAIEVIGYPSQLLHQAHRTKRSIRDLGLIISLCKLPQSNRFAEAWLYACSADPNVYTYEEVLSFLSLIYDVLCDVVLMKNPLIQNKILESFLNFSKNTTEKDHPFLEKIYLKIAEHMLRGRENGAAFSMLLDGKTYLESITGQEINITDIHEKMEAHLHYLSSSHATKSESVAVMSRWKALLDSHVFKKNKDRLTG